MQFGSVFGACNTTENIELCYRPMKTLDFTSVCNKTGCPKQPFLCVRQPKVDSWLPDRETKVFAIRLYIYVVGQPKCLVGQSQFGIGDPIGQPVFETNVKPYHPTLLLFLLLSLSIFLFLSLSLSSHKYVTSFSNFNALPDKCER